MSSDRLTKYAYAPVDLVERAVLSVLAGSPLPTAARQAAIQPAELEAALATFQQAGRQALTQQACADEWLQLYIEFEDWSAAEATAATHLLPILDRATDGADIDGWWFIRKHPCWRLRTSIRSPPHVALGALAEPLDLLAASHHIAGWWPGIYESETAAFGGTEAMATAHELFQADSRAILHQSLRPEPALGRRELSILLCTTMMLAAGLEWYEIGDAWDRVVKERPLPDDVAPERLRPMSADLRGLLLADTTPDGPLLGPEGPVHFADEWANAFREAGQALGTAAQQGRLTRGLRDILAFHVIFHWNRLGLPARMQSALAVAARSAILNQFTENY
ncbi:thiopeptide-type bacteriocin biosynthesis protein [Streptomyces lydicus]|uniref:thiopeptide-type bacteriocin biosynthesis protein n=1 Tax=Streptomyces lydicus TaxID=47763 RepID=UPI0037BC274A